MTSASSNFSLKGYNFFQANRLKGRGGGVALFVKENLNVKVLDDVKISVDGVESLFIEVTDANKNYSIAGVIYRKPSSNVHDFVESLETVLNIINKKSKTCFLMGDFNIDLMQSNQNNVIKNYVDMIFSMSFFPMITKPTRINCGTATLIDNIFTNSLDHRSVSGILLSDLSDHFPVFCISYVSHASSGSNNRIFTRHITPSAIKLLLDDLSITDWSDIFKLNDVNLAYDYFLEQFSILLDKHMPPKEKSSRTKRLKIHGLLVQY